MKTKPINDAYMLAAMGIGATMVQISILRTFRAKGLLSDAELIAIYERAKGQALRSDAKNPKLSQLIAAHIDQMWTTQGLPTQPESKH